MISEGFGGVFVTSLPAGGLGGLVGTLPAAAAAIGTKNVLGRSFYCGAVVFWELRNSRANIVEPRISFLHRDPTPVPPALRDALPAPAKS